MVGVGFLVLVGGYGLFAYGWGQLHGCNAGIADVFWPGKFTGCHPDSSASSSGRYTGAPNPNGGYATKAECEKAARTGQKGGTPCFKDQGRWYAEGDAGGARGLGPGPISFGGG
ncbi:MAG: hypothetical protein M0Z69_12340 [Actinomycetota bacterium]|nr:hypothetical protein [Actinomycetota bacterium]